MPHTERPVNPATLTCAECTGCHWSLIADGVEAVQAALEAARSHAEATGHELTTLGLVDGDGQAASVLAQLMPESAHLVAGGWLVPKGGGDV